jgi:hypothetical protein
MNRTRIIVIVRIAALAVAVVAAGVLSLVAVDMLALAGLWPSW